MTEIIQTIFNSQKEFNSDAEEFYRNYWTQSGVVKPETFAKYRAIIDKFFPQGLSGKKVLEIGVGGEGGTLLQLMEHNDVHGLDVSDSAISNCHRFGINVTKANLDSDTIPFNSDYFDVVFAFEVFEHFANPQHAVEEIRRVLKADGIFISSIPGTFTYHWPRLFYAGLFEKDNYTDFLTANEFKVTCLNDWMIRNRYGNYAISQDITSWSWYFYTQKLGSADAEGYFDSGRYFWNKRNELGLRTRPIEAIDLFRKSLNIAPGNTVTQLYMAHALLYRAINGDHNEFMTEVEKIITHIKTSVGGDKVEYLSRLLLINVEANRFRLQLLNPDDYVQLKMQLSQTSGAAAIIEEIEYEEEINKHLTACSSDDGK